MSQPRFHDPLECFGSYEENPCKEFAPTPRRKHVRMSYNGVVKDLLVVDNKEINKALDERIIKELFGVTELFGPEPDGPTPEEMAAMQVGPRKPQPRYGWRG